MIGMKIAATTGILGLPVALLSGAFDNDTGVGFGVLMFFGGLVTVALISIWL